jgi:sugar transferase EpsL
MAITILLLSWPTLFFISTVTWLLAGTPVFLKDEVLTREGRIVWIYRLRSSGSGGPCFRAFGRFLRKYHIDEWPALWNVIKGDIHLTHLQIFQLKRLGS